MPVILEDTGGTARTKVEQGVSIRELLGEADCKSIVQGQSKPKCTDGIHQARFMDLNYRAAL